MPVAARETSIYTGLTIGEYYRSMGLDVLILADSTSRWAQAMRETSGRLEEIPGEEAFPAYLDSTIKSVYERAGLLKLPDGSHGSVTLIGTVSPAGGNFEEPVTQSTLATVKAFLGLSSDRAYKRFYPAIDPLISWTRYREQLRDWFDRNLSTGWGERVQRMVRLLRDGDEVQQMMQVTGEEGVTLSDFVTFQKARLLDRAYLQQDAFDPVDVSTPLERQRATFDLLHGVLTRGYSFESKDDARRFFDFLLKSFANLNTAEQGSTDYDRLVRQIDEESKSRTAAGST
jgi:V/A-type H+-transporting ATPase subunit A